MRAIGASRSFIRASILSEACSIALMSWLLGCLVSYPISLVFTRFFGVIIIQQPMDLALSPQAWWLALLVVLFFAILASIVPSRQALRMSTRAAISYD